MAPMTRREALARAFSLVGVAGMMAACGEPLPPRSPGAGAVLDAREAATPSEVPHPSSTPLPRLPAADASPTYGPDTAPAEERAWLYLPEGWDRAWRAALASSGSRPAWVTAIGDSITNGAGSSDWMRSA